MDKTKAGRMAEQRSGATTACGQDQTRFELYCTSASHNLGRACTGRTKLLENLLPRFQHRGVHSKNMSISIRYKISECNIDIFSIYRLKTSIYLTNNFNFIYCPFLVIRRNSPVILDKKRIGKSRNVR